MVDQFLEEGFALVYTVERFSFLLGDVMQLQLFEDEAFPLQPGNNVAGYAIVDSIWFEECEGSLGPVGQRPFSLLP